MVSDEIRQDQTRSDEIGRNLDYLKGGRRRCVRVFDRLREELWEELREGLRKELRERGFERVSKGPERLRIGSSSFEWLRASSVNFDQLRRTSSTFGQH